VACVVLPAESLAAQELDLRIGGECQQAVFRLQCLAAQCAQFRVDGRHRLPAHMSLQSLTKDGWVTQVAAPGDPARYRHRPME